MYARGPEENRGLAENRGPAENRGLAENRGPVERRDPAERRDPEARRGPAELCQTITVRSCWLEALDPSRSRETFRGERILVRSLHSLYR